ncbi:MAG: V-type ATP synthase subunit E family protein [Candidatus Omnitrophica bacterium]|nr:V-type ATP synthase subunit E family protein [Candidatus Omnitrophota bacterium]
MNKEENQENSTGNVELICQAILQEAEHEARDILERARRQAEKIKESGRTKAEKEREKLWSEYEKEKNYLKQRYFSSLELEKKKIRLKEKGMVIKKVQEKIHSLAFDFRSRPDYLNFFIHCVEEGAKVLDQDKIIVFYSPADHSLLVPEMTEEITRICQSVRNRLTEVSFSPGNFSEIGVIVQSADGRIIFDNRFSARMKRHQEEIWKDLTEENLEDDGDGGSDLPGERSSGRNR